MSSRRRTRSAAAGAAAAGSSRRVALNLTGLLVFVVMVFPVYWMVSTAFKPGNDVLSYTPKWFPDRPTLVNFRDAIERPYFWDNVKNSLIVVGAVVAVVDRARVPRRARAREVPLLRPRARSSS